MKTKTRYLLLCIVTISIIVVGLIFLPPRWSYLIFGVLAFIIGSVVLTEEWKTGKRVSAIVFIIAITVGGLLTTKGWNEWGNYSQKKALIVGLAREWRVNEIYRHLPPLSFDPNDSNWGVVIKLYTPFKTSASNSVLASNLFDLRNKDEQEMCWETVVYEVSATSCNEFFTFLNWELTRKGTTGERRKEVYQYIVSGSGSLYGGFKESHEKIGKLLKEKYSWALEEATLLLNDKARKALKWPSEETLNNKDSK